MTNKLVYGSVYIILPPEDSYPSSQKAYIGSTKLPLNQRKSIHKHLYGLYQLGRTNTCASFKLFDEFGFDSCRFILLAQVLYESSAHLRTLEQHYMDTLPHMIQNRAVRIPIEIYQRDYRNKLVNIEKRRVWMFNRANGSVPRQ